MFKWFRDLKKEVQESKKEFDKVVEEYKEHSKEMHEECVQILCENAEVMGKADIEIDYNKDLYRNLSDFELAKISTAHIKGKLEQRIERLEIRVECDK